ncbi:MAG: hypothetical protein IJ996_02255 [Clostridia bacterium]|nr:hypothetical protein [Clostridia bacterium]
MGFWKKVGKALLFPHVFLVGILVPLSVTLLIYSFVFEEQTAVISIIAYALSAYTLTVVCFRIPQIIAFFKRLSTDNKYVLRWRTDVRLRVNIGLYATLAFNVAYAVFQLGLGLYHASVWFWAMSVYYSCLGLMRFLLARYAKNGAIGEIKEWKRYRFCGICMLGMNVAVSAVMGMVLLQDVRIVHHQITTIALAACTFTSLTMGIVNMVKYRKYQSPVYSASKTISTVSAVVSMFTLEVAMLTSFGESASVLFQDVMMTCTAIAVSAFILTTSIYMIVKSTKTIKNQGEIEDGRE